MQDDAGRHTEIRRLQWGIVWLLALRLWMMAAYPLIDSTEARYGELARMTAEGGYWLMPHMAPGVPFLAKPPLSTWLAGGAAHLLGVHEFALRLPSLLTALVTAWLLWWAARDFDLGRPGRWFAMATLATAPIFVISAGAVMTDATQMAIVAAAMVMSWRALRQPDRRRWRMAFWALVGLGTLSKGLATLALIGLPLAAYALFGEGIALVWRRLWDLRGVLLAGAVCLAWYLPAEAAHPGFVRYFVVGEHFQRFLEPGWAGDRYGSAHQEPLGMIWVFWMAGLGTWTAVFVALTMRMVRSTLTRRSMEDRWLWCWMLAPLCLFSASQNIIMTYVLTAVPPFGLLVGRWAQHDHGRLRRVVPGFVVAIALVATVVGATWLPRYLDARSARAMVAAAHALAPPRELFIHGVYPFSASFYSRGTARRADYDAALDPLFQRPGVLMIVRLDRAEHLMQNHPVRELARNARAVLLEVVERP